MLVRLCLVTVALAGTGAKAEMLSVGKTTPQGIAWIPVDVGVHEGIFARLGVTPAISAASGGAKLHQAMVAGAIEIGLGSGTDYAFLVKGAAEKAIAEMADRLLDLGFTAVPEVKTIADLRAARIGVAAPASMTWWLVLMLNRSQGWSGADAATPVAVGGSWPTFTAAMKTNQVRAVVSDSALGYKLEQTGEAHPLAAGADFAPDFISHVIFATDATLANKPDAVKRFLQGWFESVRWMHAHRAEAIAIATEVSGLDALTAARAYDHTVAMLREQGHFEPKGMAGVAASLTDLELVDATPDLWAYTTEAFLPD